VRFFKGIKIKIGERILRNKLCQVERQVSFKNFDNADLIGIVTDCADADFFKAVISFAEELQDKKKHVSVISYTEGYDIVATPGKKIPVYYFTDKHINWYCKPNSEETNKFVAKEFDFLLDLRTKNFLQTNFIIGLSKAKLKVGIGTKHNMYYDFMLDVNEKKDIKNNIKQIYHYLALINKATKPLK
jgi:predicted RND superfamily exporter protein